MSCNPSQNAENNQPTDRLETGSPLRLFDRSAVAWLVGQAVRYLNTADKEGELSYQRTIELLRRADAELVETVMGILRMIPSGDGPVRWCLFHVLGDAANARGADFLVHAALEKVPQRQPDAGCESERDVEILVRTMAIVALQRIATRYSEAKEQVLKVVSGKPERPLLIEAVKAGVELGMADRMREILPKEDHWILDIRRARVQEVVADPERDDGKERGFTPPRTGEFYTAPRGKYCCVRKET